MYPQCFEQNYQNVKFFPRKFSIFAFEKNLYILHGHVFIMERRKDGKMNQHK